MHDTMVGELTLASRVQRRNKLREQVQLFVEFDEKVWKYAHNQQRLPAPIQTQMQPQKQQPPQQKKQQHHQQHHHIQLTQTQHEQHHLQLPNPLQQQQKRHKLQTQLKLTQQKYHQQPQPPQQPKHEQQLECWHVLEDVREKYHRKFHEIGTELMFENGTLFVKQVYELMQCYQAKINRMKSVQEIVVPDTWHARCLIRTLLMPQTNVWDRTHAEIQLFNTNLI